MVLRDVSLRDPAGREWLTLRTVTLTFRDWPGTSPVLTHVAGEDARIHMYFAKGRLDAPIRTSAGGASQAVDLSALAVRNITLSVVDDLGRKAGYDNLQLRLDRREKVYEVSLQRSPAPQGQTMSLSGPVQRATGEADFAVRGAMPVGKAGMAVLLRAAGFRLLKSGEAQIDVDLRVKGRPGDWRTVNVTGGVAVRQGTLDGPHGPVARGLNVAVVFGGRTGNLSRFVASGCGGQLSGTARAAIGPDGVISGAADVKATGVDLPELTEVLGGVKNKARGGTLSLDLHVERAAGAVTGRGVLALRQADAMSLPLVPELFSGLGLPAHEALSRSDGAAAFDVQGPVLRVRQMRLANPLSALDAEPGGTVNLQTHDLNLYVVAAPLKHLESVLKGVMDLPVLRIVGNPLLKLRDAATRFHIVGNWSDPSGQLVRKDAVQDLGEGTVGFFRDVTVNGGKFGDDTFRNISELFGP